MNDGMTTNKIIMRNTWKMFNKMWFYLYSLVKMSVFHINFIKINKWSLKLPKFGNKFYKNGNSINDSNWKFQFPYHIWIKGDICRLFWKLRKKIETWWKNWNQIYFRFCQFYLTVCWIFNFFLLPLSYGLSLYH